MKKLSRKTTIGLGTCFLGWQLMFAPFAFTMGWTFLLFTGLFGIGILVLGLGIAISAGEVEL